MKTEVKLVRYPSVRMHTVECLRFSADATRLIMMQQSCERCGVFVHRVEARKTNSGARKCVLFNLVNWQATEFTENSQICRLQGSSIVLRPHTPSTGVVSSGEGRMDRKLAGASASRGACALVSVANCKSRFRIMPLRGMHANRDGDRDRTADVTAESIDVSDQRQRLEGRGLTCEGPPTCHSTRSTANAVLCTQ